MFAKTNQFQKIKVIISSREYYVLNENKEDCWLFNPICKVQPSLDFVNEKGPCVLTCKKHSYGSKLFMIHPCQLYYSLTSQNSDQTCQAVIKPHLIKPVQSSKYSTLFQMHQQSGKCQGIDTCSVTKFGRRDINSKLFHESEARSIANRLDINVHLAKIREEKKISPIVEIYKQSFSWGFS